MAAARRLGRALKPKIIINVESIRGIRSDSGRLSGEAAKRDYCQAYQIATAAAAHMRSAARILDRVNRRAERSM